MAYIGIPPFGQTVRTVTTFTATASQTTFTPTGGYIVGYVDVMYNGVKLVDGDDYTATNGTTVALTVAAAAGDTVEIVSYMPVSLADTYRMAEADNRFVNATGDTMSGALTMSAGNIIRVENPATGRYGLLATDSQGTYLSSHNGSGEPLTLNAPSSSAYMNLRVAGQDRLYINNAGCITKPFQPAFRAARTTSFVTTTATEITFQTESFDVGGYYNNGNGRFTAPVAGRYFFHSSLQPTTPGIGVNLQLYVNGAAIQYMSNGWSSNLPSRADIALSGFLQLAAGDYVSVYATSSSSCTWDNHGQFQGYLVG